MSENTEQLTEQMSKFQKIWMETFTRMAQSAFTFSPDSAPPEMVRQMRSGIFQALAQSWDEYLRSPQFMEATKQWMDSAIFYRKMTNDLLTKARHETEDIAREDVDSVMLAVRHMEKRILDRLEDLTARVDALDRTKANGSARKAAGTAAKATPEKRTARPRTRKTPPETQKGQP